jgi:hypothetical protein
MISKYKVTPKDIDIRHEVNLPKKTKTYSAYKRGTEICMGKICYQDGVTSTITIVNEEVRLPQTILYLGNSSKFGQADMIGKHGMRVPLNIVGG